MGGSTTNYFSQVSTGVLLSKMVIFHCHVNFPGVYPGSTQKTRLFLKTSGYERGHNNGGKIQEFTQFGIFWVVVSNGCFQK